VGKWKTTGRGWSVLRHVFVERIRGCGGGGGSCVTVHAMYTHLIGIMFQRAVVTHVPHAVQIRVALVHVVHVGTVVLLVQNAWKQHTRTIQSTACHLLLSTHFIQTLVQSTSGDGHRLCESCHFKRVLLTITMNLQQSTSISL